MQQDAKYTGYVISSDDRILSVFGGWDVFALNNSAPDTEAMHVVGHSLWYYVNGHETQSFLNALFFHVRRTGRPVALQYNCSSPDHLRLAEMRVRLLGEQCLEVTHEIHTEEPRKNSDRSECNGAEATLTLCSQCLTVSVDQEQAVGSPPKIDLNRNYTFVVCSNCRTAARTQIDMSLAAPKVSSGT